MVDRMVKDCPGVLVKTLTIFGERGHLRDKLMRAAEALGAACTSNAIQVCRKFSSGTTVVFLCATGFSAASGNARLGLSDLPCLALRCKIR
jgi:hypothetical protein